MNNTYTFVFLLSTFVIITTVGNNKNGCCYGLNMPNNILSSSSSSLANATNILQQLLEQANKLQTSNGGSFGAFDFSNIGSGDTGSGGPMGNLGTNNTIINNPIGEFFRNFIMFFLNLFNMMIRMFSGGLMNTNRNVDNNVPLMAKWYSNLNGSDIDHVSDDDHHLKLLHVKAHGPNCACEQFSRANLPQFSSNEKDIKFKEEFENEIQQAKSKRSISKVADDSKNNLNNRLALSAEHVIDFLDAKMIQNLLNSFIRSQKDQKK